MLVTQFAAPRLPPGMIERPRLSEQLRVALEQPVTLVCAAAGSGKTALVSAHAARCEHAVAWVSLEPGDRLWGAVTTALDLPGHDPVTLVNALAERQEPFMLVLDDVHVLRAKACREQLAFLVLHAPETLRLVLIARSDPALPLHVLRLRGRLGEIRAADLAFTGEEAAALLAAHGLELDHALVESLRERTEGWAAGLRLAALSLRRHDDPERFVTEFAGDDRAVGDYLVAEVLDHESPAMRDFLLRAALADRICGPLADALTGRHGGADALAALERTTGFVLGLDNHREWFRFHGLFASLLRARARSELAGRLGELHARAALWHQAHGTPAEALQHAVQAAAWDLVVELVAEHGLELHASGALAALAAAQPPNPDAELRAALAYAAVAAGDTSTAAAHLEAAEQAAAALPAERRDRYVHTRALARLAQARLTGDLAAAEDAAAVLPDTPIVHALVGEAALWGNDLARAHTELTHAAGLDGPAGWALGRPERTPAGGSSAALAHGGALAHAGGSSAARASALGCLALVDVLRDGTADRADGVQTAEAHVARALRALLEARVDEVDGHLAHVRPGRQPVGVVVALIRARLTRDPDGLEEYELLHPQVAATPYARATLPALGARLRGESPSAEGLEPVDVESAALLALAHAHERESAAAARVLDRALELATETGVRWPFVELGEAMAALLRHRLHSPTAHRALIIELIGSGVGVQMTAPLRDPLSPREQTLLRYLPTQLANREIAAELFITTNTVKTHLRSIYRKLEVEGRREAVARARDLNLLGR